MLDWLLDPWSDPIDLRALVEVVALGATGGALGCWIVFYRLAYSAESLAHALLPGLVHRGARRARRSWSGARRG